MKIKLLLEIKESIIWRNLLKITQRYGKRRKKIRLPFLTDVSIVISWNDHFISQCLLSPAFTSRRWDVCVSAPNKHVFLHLENKICRSGCPCSTAVLHYNPNWSHILPLPETFIFCDLDTASCHIAILINCAALMQNNISLIPFDSSWILNLLYVCQLWMICFDNSNCFNNPGFINASLISMWGHLTLFNTMGVDYRWGGLIWLVLSHF